MASIFQRGRVWWILYYDNGLKIQHSLKTKDKTVAKFKKNEIENKLAVGSSPMVPQDALAADVFEEFINYCKATLRPRTIDYYKETLAPFIKFLSQTRIQNLNEKSVTDYINTKPHLKAGMVWHIIKAVKTFLNFCVKRKYLAVNPVTMRKPKIPKKPPECWSLEEIKRILAAADDPIIYGMIYLNLHIGLRPAELRRLKWSDIDFKNEILTVQEAKDGEFRRIDIHPKAMEFLTKFERNGELIFPGVDDGFLRRHAKAIRKKAKVRNIRRFWYAIRHTFGTEYYKRTGDLKGLQEIFGHSKIEMTTVYVNPQGEHRRQQIRKLDYEGI